jgi:signal transduction histidine kinase
MKRTDIFGNLNWLFFLLALGAIVISVFYLPPFWKIFNSGILISLSILIFWNTVETNRSNARLHVEKQRLHSIIDNLAEGVILYDQDFKILVWNHAAERIFNLKAEDILGQSFTMKVRQDSSPRLRPLLTVLFPALATSIVRRTEPGAYPQVMDISFDDPPLELRVSTDRIFDTDGSQLGFIKLIHDRTREIMLLKSKSEFITVASHQLRTPLSGMNWALEDLKKQPLPKEQRELIESSIGATNRLLKIVNDILDVAKIEEGQFGYQFQEVDIIQFIEEALQAAEPVAAQYRVRLYFEKPKETIPPIMMDVQKIGMVLSNLLDNAVKYNIPNGEVIVRVEKMPDKHFAIVSVRDTGIGIPPEAMQKMFTQFFRADNALKVAVEGTGLGLYIAKNIIRRHGGKIWVESNLNRGSVFSFTLPTNPELIPPKEFIYGD